MQGDFSCKARFQGQNLKTNFSTFSYNLLSNMTLIIRQLVNICFDLGKQHIPRFPNTKIITSGIF